MLPPEIFKAYDIRGIVGRTLTPSDRAHDRPGARQRSRASASATRSPSAATAACPDPSWSRRSRDGIRSAGVDVIDVGMVATPMPYFAAQHLGTGCSVMVTGSHNPPDYNGLKMVIDATTLSGDDIQALRARIERDDLATRRRRAACRRTSRVAYLDRIVGDIKLARPMRIAVDCGNGVAGAFAPELYRRLGCDVVELFCDVDGNFPNHHPDPSQPKNLEDLRRRLAQGDCELGLAFDGDGDRLGVVTPAGNIIYPDRQLMLFAADVLTRAPGATIIYDVKSTRNLKPWIVEHGGVPMLWKTGHSLIKAKMKEVGAALAGEMSGHTFFGERWYGFDDGLYAGARLLEILSRHRRPRGGARCAARRGVDAGAQHRLRRGRAARADRPAAGRRALSRRVGRHPHRRPARRVSGRLRPRARVEHHAGDRAALRGRRRRRH